jgi:phosphatidylserine synthase
MELSRNQYGFPVMNNEIIYVSLVFVLIPKKKELVVISTSLFAFLIVSRVKTFQYSGNINKAFISSLLTKNLVF